MNQLILPYQKNVKQTFENFYSNDASNLNILESILNIYNNNNNQIFLWGENFSGKSHILYSACNYFSKEKKCVYLPIKDYKLFSPDIINSFSEYDLICIDDIDVIFGIEEWEHSFFTLVNKILESSKKIIYTSSSSLLSRNINLKDLHSRLSWGLVFKINNADDTIKEKILQKTILENEYNISFNVCKYLLQREERNLSSLVNIIHKAGLYSFSTQKKVSTRDINDILA